MRRRTTPPPRPRRAQGSTRTCFQTGIRYICPDHPRISSTQRPARSVALRRYVSVMRALAAALGSSRPSVWPNPRAASRNRRSMTLKESAALISLVASLALAVAKLVLGLWIGSLALITEAFHSGADFLATGRDLARGPLGEQSARRLASVRPRQVREHRRPRRGDAAAPSCPAA